LAQIDKEVRGLARQRENLIHEVMQAALEFQGRRLWERFTNFDCFAVRLPGEQDPLVACVMGDAGEQFGLMVLRGPHAAESLLALTSDEGPGDDVAEAMDMLSFSMDDFGELDAEAQAFYRKAGIHPRHDERLPNFLVKPPHRQLRLPDDTELAVLLGVLKAAVIADRRKLLKPAEPDDAEGVCVLTWAGDPAEPTVSVSRERLPQPAAASRPRASAASDLDLSGLQLLDGTWLVGTPAVPGGVKDDDRSIQLLLVVDDASEMILHSKAFFSGDIQEAVDAMVELFRGHQPGGRRGIAGTIVFSNRRLHDAVAPALQQAGVECVFMPVIPKLRKLVEDLLDLVDGPMTSLGEGLQEDAEDDTVPADDDLAGWKAADHRLSQRFAENFCRDKRLRSSRAIKRYFDSDDAGYFFKEHERQGVIMAFSAWGMLDYRPKKTSRTQAEKALAQGLPKAEAMLLSARMESHPTVYRVDGHDPKAGTVDLEDVLLGGAVTVCDQLLSENIDNSTFLVCRTFPAGRFHFIELAGPMLGSGMGTDAVEFLRRCGMEFTRDGLKRQAHMFGWLWGWMDRWQANWRPPRLCNTDGEELLFHTASFAVGDPDATRQALLQRNDIDHDEQEDEYVWSKETGKGAKMLGGPVTLGRIEFVGDELVLTANSAKRFEAARAWLTKLPGVSFRDVRTESAEPGADRPLDGRIAKPEPVEITPEIGEYLQEVLDRQYMEWIDTPLPILGGKTPRQACRTADGRQQVTTMIRTMPDPMGRATVHVPRQAMIQELGLEATPEGTKETGPDYSQIAVRYKRLRATSLELNNSLLEYVSKQEIEATGRKLGLWHDGTLVFDTEDESSVLFDEAIHSRSGTGPNAVDRYLADHPPKPGSDQETVLTAKQRSYYSLFMIESIVPDVGVHVHDVLRDRHHLLADVGFSQTGIEGMVLATRVTPYGDFIATTGAALPADAAILEQIRALPIISKKPSEIENLPAQEMSEFAATVIRLFLDVGASRHVYYAGADDDGEDHLRMRGGRVAMPVSHSKRVGRNDPCPCGSGRKYKKCCGR